MTDRAVILDFGGVICFHPTDQQIASAAARCDLTPPDFLRAFWKNRLAYDAGLDPYEYWRGVAREAGRTFDDALSAEMIGREIDFWSRFDDRMLNWIHELRGGGTRVGILSNLPSPLGTKLIEDGFMKRFDHATLSYELGVVKPQRAIYEDAVRGLGVAAGDALFVDDRPENVEGAVAVGLRGVLYTNWEDFRDSDAARAPGAGRS